jgi:5-methylcytosine-specific restriction endonuclease McrA|tara:strand:+ start:2551 stop:2844 length:294 start_codon:yes stop_codon:yes gene_type:complete
MATEPKKRRKPEAVCRTIEQWDAACRAGHKNGRRSIPYFVWFPALSKQNGVCAHCGSKGILCVDHITPISKGGSNKSSNLQGLCDYCNTRKGGRFIG